MIIESTFNSVALQIELVPSIFFLTSEMETSSKSFVHAVQIVDEHGEAMNAQMTLDILEKHAHDRSLEGTWLVDRSLSTRDFGRMSDREISHC